MGLEMETLEPPPDCWPLRKHRQGAHLRGIWTDLRTPIVKGSVGYRLPKFPRSGSGWGSGCCWSQFSF